jgi:hypothetical protein
MNRVMFDSVNIKGIPHLGGNMVAYYTNGIGEASAAEIESAFPGWSHVPIDVKGDNAHIARVADVETLDITPARTEEWIRQFNDDNPAFHTGGRPVIYCNRSTIPAVRLGTGRWLLGKDYYLWVAAPKSMYTGFGVVACQNVWSRTFNSSVVFSDQWVPSKS